MARQRNIIPIHLGLNKSVEEVGLSVSSAALYDCVIDVEGDNAVVNRRPCLKEFMDTGESASVDGLFWWEAQQKMVVICNGKTITIDDTTGSFTKYGEGEPLKDAGGFTIYDAAGIAIQPYGSSEPTSVFTPGNRVTFADFSTSVYAGDGGIIKKIGASSVANHGDADAPQLSSHVAFLDRYLLANEMETQKCHRSDVGAPDSFTSNWFSSEAQLDRLRAVAVENLEVYLLGDRTLEVWEDTGADDPFSRVSGGYIPSGTIAPHTFKFCSAPVNTFVWLDHTKSLVALNGRVTASLSDAMNRYLQLEGKILSDAAGDYIKAMGHSFYVLHLPTEGETPVFDFKSGLWSHWAYWNSIAGEHQRWRGNCHAYAPAWGKICIGDRSNGKVYTLDTETYQDAGEAVKTMVRTAHIDRGDFGAIKRTNYVDFRAKKTAPGGGSTITLAFKYRDNGETTWSNEHTITLSAASGATDYIARVRRLGRYRTRQWEFYCTDNAPVAILPPVEDYEVTY